LDQIGRDLHGSHASPSCRGYFCTKITQRRGTQRAGLIHIKAPQQPKKKHSPPPAMGKERPWTFALHVAARFAAANAPSFIDFAADNLCP